MGNESDANWLRWWRQGRRRGRAKSSRSASPVPLWRQIPWRRLILFVITVVVLFLSMTPHQLFVPVPFVEGQVFPYDIRAFRTVRYHSEIETERRRQEVAASVPRQYRLDPSVSDRWEAILKDLFDGLVSLHDETQPLNEKIQQVRDRFGINMPNQVFAILLKAEPSTLRYMQEMLLRFLDAEWRRGIRPSAEEQTAALQKVKGNIDRLPLTTHYRWALKQLAEIALQPNMAFDPIATEEAREKARATVEPVWRTIRAGDLIARKGELVTAVHLEKLRALGHNLPALIGTFLLAMLLTLGIAFFLQKALPEIAANDRLLVLLMLIWLLCLALVRFLMHPLGLEVAFTFVATASMMTTVLVSPFFSLFAAGIFALVTTLGMAIEWQTLPASALRPFLVTATVGIAAAFLSADLRVRAQLVRAGVSLGVGAFALQLIVGIVTGETLTMGLDDFLRLCLWSVLTGAIPPALTLAGISVLERPFGITTVFTLMELSNPHAPLLRELAEKAPGTFQGSLMVARLAQEAAKRIGANELLAWVSGLYHDIGKVTRPGYFVENQPPGAVNPHDHLSPQMSAKVLMLHVHQGEELAQKYRLPQPIIDVIREHHGTSLMTYFLAKAKERGELLNESDYRYNGPKPRSKESALIMLADSVEAAVRSLNNPTPNDIERVVEDIIAAKIADGQLDDTPLSFREVQGIKRAFIETLKSIYHQRIEYPKVEQERHANHAQRVHNGSQDRPTAAAKGTDGQAAASG